MEEKVYVVPPEQGRKWQLAQLEGYELLSKAYESGDPAAIAEAQADLDAAMINVVPEALPEEVRKQFQAAWGQWQRNLQMNEIMVRSATAAEFYQSRAELYRRAAERTRISMAWDEARQSGDPLQQKYEKEFFESVSKRESWNAGEISEMVKKWYAGHESAAG